MTEEKRIEPGRHHVSKTYIPLMLFRGLWTVLLLVIIGALNMIGSMGEISEFVSMNVSMNSIILFSIIGFVVLMAILTVFVYLSYKRITWEITDEEVHIYKGLIVRKKSHIPFRRIHSVNIEAKILDRIFGVVTLKLDTAAGSAGTEDAKIPAMKLSAAEAVRAEIFMRKNAAQGSAAETTVTGGGNALDDLSKENEQLRGLDAGDPFEMKVDAEYRLTNKELVLYCLANGKVFAVIFAAFMFIYQFVGILNDVNEELGKTADRMIDSVFAMGPVIIAALFLVALVVSLVISFLTRALTYGNFVVRRFGGRVEVSTGLLQKRSTGVAVERIQTLKIKQGLLQRILGYAEISLETASGISKSSNNDQDKNPDVVIHPFIRKDMVEDYMEKMLKEFEDRPENMEGLTGLAMRRSIVRYGLWTLILVILPVNLAWYIVREYGLEEGTTAGVIEIINNSVIWSSAGFFILMLVIGWAVWKGRAYARNNNYVAMRKGIIGRKKIFVPKKKIQYAQVSQNPFQKRVNLGTIKANTAAMGSTFQSIKDIDQNIGDDYLGWIEHKHSGKEA